jgi:hypothetical protein
VVAALPFISAASTQATAQPVSPAPGAVVRSWYPLFTWNLPANERSQAIYLAKKPDTTPDGSFYSENVVQAGTFYHGDPRQWTAAGGLYASRYWWLVVSYDLSTNQTYRSSPIDFTIPANARILGLRTRRHHNIRHLTIEARWRSNVRDPVVQAWLSTRSGRRVWSARRREHNVLGSDQTTTFDLKMPKRLKAGTRLRLLIKVGRTSLRGAVRAP